MNTKEDGLSFAVTATLNDGRWQVREFEDNFFKLSTSINAVRAMRSEGPAFALLCVEDEYFVIVRPTPSRVFLFLSDATMSVDDDFAAKVMDELDADIPDLDPDELDDVDPWPEGDFDILADLGLSEEVLAVICDDLDLAPSEQLLRIAEELGFDNQLARAVDLD
ncbi:tRNA adenosine deaminase-associated protein [Corynebacterium callunae]|uniref:tRNA adenosine deaminase-associated protein n=1 Tax=Corynebacterium callunae TaxID=1721 RepID=UPI0039820100